MAGVKHTLRILICTSSSSSSWWSSNGIKSNRPVIKSQSIRMKMRFYDIYTVYGYGDIIISVAFIPTLKSNANWLNAKVLHSQLVVCFFLLPDTNFNAINTKFLCKSTALQNKKANKKKINKRCITKWWNKKFYLESIDCYMHVECDSVQRNKKNMYESTKMHS